MPLSAPLATWRDLRLRFLVVLGVVAVVVLLVVGFSVYALLPGLIESRLAANLQGRYGLKEKPTVDVSSSFPPELLLGRIDRIRVQMDSFTKQGIRLRDLRIELKDVNVSVLSLLSGDLEREIEAASLVAEVPEESINEYLRKNNLGLEGGEIDVRPQSVVYRSADVLFGFSLRVGLDLQVAGPHTVGVIPQRVTVGGFPLPSFLTEPLASGGQTLDVGELPLGAELVSVEPSEEDALVVRAEKK